MKATDSHESDRTRRSHIRLLSLLLEDRKLGWAMLGGGLGYLILSLTGLNFYICPVRALTGLKCPGCGLTSGSKALLAGNWHEAIQHHWFTPVFVVFWIAVGIGLIAPPPAREKFLGWVRTSERITRWPAVLGIALIIYTLTRNMLGS
ncbi:DUF2752 domain-containing protein [Oceaniferula spumae]